MQCHHLIIMFMPAHRCTMPAGVHIKHKNLMYQYALAKIYSYFPTTYTF